MSLPPPLPPATQRWALLVALCSLAATAVCGCTTPIARGLEESQATRVVVALEEAGIVSSKQPEGDESAAWSVVVGRDDATAAASVLVEQSLPPPPTTTGLDAPGAGTLVPSQRAEQARLIATTASELERSLRELDSVLTARVHLAVPTTDPLGDAPSFQPSASVLLRFRGSTTPIAVERVQTLVAGAVPGLEKERVAVVSIPTPARPAKGHLLTQLGPIVVTRSSVMPLRLVLGVLAGLNLALLGGLVWLWTQLRRTRAEFLRSAKDPTQSAVLPPPTTQSPGSRVSGGPPAG